MEKYTQEEIQLLDQFAGQAMNVLLSADFHMEKLKNFEALENDKILANVSYRVARALIEERKEVLKDEKGN